MGSTKCYDILIKQAKKKKIKINAGPGEVDPEYQSQVDTEIKAYQTQADTIYKAEKTIIEAKFKANKAKVDVTAPIKQAQATKDRFNSTDAEKYGEENIKTSVQKELSKLMEGDDAYQTKLEEEREKIKKKKDAKAQAALKKLQEKKEKKSEELRKKKEKAREKIEKKKREKGVPSQDLIQKASEIGKSTDKDIDEISAQYDKSLKEYEDLVYGQAIENGEKEGAKLVGEYNNKIRDTAQKTFNKNKDKLAKAQVMKEQAKQSAILKLGALLGL